MFLFVTQAFWGFIVRAGFLVCNLGLFEITEWESCIDCYKQTYWKTMQRDSDTCDSGKPLILCEKKHE